MAAFLAGRADGDTFGDASAPTVICLQPTDTTLDATDCDDTDDEAFPGAPERCNGADDDCDGAAGADLGKLEVLSGVKDYPVRIKCATLAWHALRAALEGGDSEAVTTE